MDGCHGVLIMHSKVSYRQLWSEQMTAKRNSYENPEAARAYDNSLSIWKDGENRAAGMIETNPLDTVLDIGSGPGVLSIPLARRVRQVTVIDPSRAMLDLLSAHQREEGLSNVKIIEGRWEEIDHRSLGRFDIVIASYSLHMKDMGSALSAINAAAKKRVYLYWFCGMTSWEKICHDLYPIVYKKRFSLYPKTELLYGMLSEMGISANVTSLAGTAFDHIYPNMQAAIVNMRSRLGLETSDTRFDGLFRDYINDHYHPEGEGWRFKDKSNYVQLMWEPKGE